MKVAITKCVPYLDPLPYACLIDCQEASDLALRQGMVNAFKITGVNVQLLKVIESFYHDDSLEIRGVSRIFLGGGGDFKFLSCRPVCWDVKIDFLRAYSSKKLINEFANLRTDFFMVSTNVNSRFS